jgi:hypothetical protein
MSQDFKGKKLKHKISGIDVIKRFASKDEGGK